MVKKLTSRLLSPTAWKSLYSAFFLIIALFFAEKRHFSFWSLVLFACVALWAYRSSSFEHDSLVVSFFTIVCCGLLGALVLHGVMLFAFLFWIGVLLFLHNGLANLLFKDRFLIFSLFNTALFFLFFVNFFYFSNRFSPFLLAVVFLSFAFLMFRETFMFLGIESSTRGLLLGFGVGMFLFQIAFLMSFLPLGFLGSALFLTLLTMILRDAIVVHVQGFLDNAFLFRQLTLFLIFGVLIFASISWVF